MPILSYRCKECGKEFAKILLNPNRPPRSCPVCGAAEPEELGPAFSQDMISLERMMCSSCDSCGDSSCGVAPAS
ncbi:MAG: hypothetical protein HY912_05690 [Desulfomonile tiedjei]|uniref:Putative regulatory protein FmdB zinc ribbon domain-containing protein n=1 Tax=Desulfomonile tiedjei TaxID=2358 RepID=A0A9D6Z2M9_9BACT|nr:hypothetical protein [Desulfomonile tiedjei]